MNRLKKYLLHGAYTRICMWCLTALLLLLACCSRDDGYTPLLREAEDLIRSNPDSALSLLDNAESSFSNASEPRRMRYMLIHGKAQNMAYVDFTSDEDVKRIVSYYDEHGTTKDRMQAYYLMGCVYRDLGEVPLAVENFQTVVSLADTTSADCDLRTLSAVYSQLGDLYHTQLLLTEEIDCREASANISIQLKDTLNYIYDYSRIAGAYILLCDSLKAESILLKTIDMYNQICEYQRGLNSSITLMGLYANKPDSIVKLKEMVKEYDCMSNAFDEQHNLPPSKYRFFEFKAVCFELENNLDSAEFYYRKMAYPGMDYVSKDPMYRGLFGIFQKKNMPDSIVKYANLFCEANDSSIAISDRELTAQIGAMYKYARLQRETNKSRMDAAESRSRFLVAVIVGVSSVFLLTCAIFFLLWRRHRKKQELKQIRMQYVEVRDQLDSKLAEIDEMEHLLDSQESVLRSSQEKAKELMGYVRKLSEEKVLKDYVSHSGELRSQDIVRRFYTYAKSTVDVVPKQDWEELYKAFEAFCPKLMIRLDTLSSHAEMTKSVCLLTLMGIRASDIANLVGMSVQSVSNARLQANKEFFGQASARTLRKNLEMEYNIYL